MMKKDLCIWCGFLMTMLFSGCSAVGDIFNAGVWVGVIVVIAIFVLLVVLIRKGTGNS